MNEQRLSIIHGLERELENLHRAAGMIGVYRDELNRGDGAREVAVALTNLETTILWLRHAIDATRRS